MWPENPDGSSLTIQIGFWLYVWCFQDHDGESERNDSTELPKLNKGKTSSFS